MNRNKLIPRTFLFSDPDKANVQISKNGEYISHLSPKDGALNIFVGKSTEVFSSKAITSNKKRGIRHYFWAYDNKNIIYLQDNEGDENYYLHILNIETLNDVIIKTDSKTKTQIIKTSHRHPNTIIIGLNDRRKDLFDIYKLNIRTHKKELLYQNDQFIDFDLDDDYNIVFSYATDQDGGLKVFHKNNLYINIPHSDAKTTKIIGLASSKNHAYFLDSRNRDKAALFILDIDKKKQHLLFKPTNADINNIIIHPKTRSLQAITINYKRDQYYTNINGKSLDKNFAASFDLLKHEFLGADIHITSKNLNDDKWIVLVEYDYKSAEYYLFTKSKMQCRFLFKNRCTLGAYKLNKMEPVIIKSRDGLTLVSYLTKATTANKSELPMVLYVHGGPNARDVWGYNPIHQWLSNRGYSVLSVNYRGSTGFGKNFINAGDGEWSAKMHDDLIDAVNWAVDNGIASKDKIAIMGGSYGGYATLVGLTFTPNTFACGIDIVGPSNLVSLAESIPEYWKPFLKDLLIKLGGDPSTKKGKKILQDKSPLFFVDEIKKPLLIGQGANDPRVKQHESDQIVQCMKRKNIPVTYILYPDEGHGFQRPENKLSFFAIAEGFLSKHLGGEYELITDNLSRSSIRIIEGKQYLPYREET